MPQDGRRGALRGFKRQVFFRYVLRVSQIRAHCLRTLRDCVLPLVEYTAVIERKCTTYSTSALFGPSTPDCLLIHITKYTYTRRLETEPLFYPSQAVFGRSAGRSTASSGTETTLTVGFPSFFLSLVGGLLRPRRGGGGTCARWRGARGRCTPGAGTRLGS